jgi:hypothetical protein
MALGSSGRVAQTDGSGDIAQGSGKKEEAELHW